MNSKTVIGSNLRRLMEDRRITTQCLSYDARVKPCHIWNILSGSTRDPKLSYVAKIARALDVPIEDLAKGHDPDDSQLTRN